jgi:hypothetical protein
VVGVLVVAPAGSVVLAVEAGTVVEASTVAAALVDVAGVVLVGPVEDVMGAGTVVVRREGAIVPPATGKEPDPQAASSREKTVATVAARADLIGRHPVTPRGARAWPRGRRPHVLA